MQSESRFRVRPLPRPEGALHDRRRRRSSSAAVAIELALTSAAARGGLDVVVVVDDDGMLVAKSRTCLDLTLLAAITPIVGRGHAIPRVKKDGVPRDMAVHVMELGGEKLYIAAVGGKYLARARELGESSAAAQRILA
jgi:hypothetical protein